MSDTRTRILYLKKVIATAVSSNSITDKGPVYDDWHYFTLAQKLLDGRFSKLLSSLNIKGIHEFHIGIPKIYYQGMQISSGSDTDIISGRMNVTAKGYVFPEIKIVFDIRDRKIQVPKTFKHRDAEFELTPEGVKEFLLKVNPKFKMIGEAKYPSPTASGAKIETVFFGDPSRDRDDLMLGRGGGKRMREGLEPIRTGDQEMVTKSTGNFIGV